jgi:nitrate reductase alpha subunit
LVRVSWDEALEMVAAAHVHAIREFGPDRVAGFSPIPAMSMVSHAAGARFISLIGGAMLSFYDWYADLTLRPHGAKTVHNATALDVAITCSG